MKRILLLLVAIILSTQAQSQLNYTYSKRLDDVMDSVCNRFKIKGVSASIIVPNEGVWERCYGESHAGVPVTSNMYLGIGSNTKTYIAALMLKLQEQSKLDLDDTIGQWIQHPNVPGSITIRQMLNHTSGLYSFTANADMNNYILPDFTRIWPADSVLNLVKAPVAAPGSPWDYSNTNFLIAGMIAAKVTGKTVQQALRDEILTPQGLNEAYYYPQEIPSGTMPHSWSLNLSGNGTLEDLMAVHNYSHNAMFSIAGAAGCIVATAKDNAMFWDKLMSGKILNSSSMAEFETLVPIAPGQGYGLGVFKISTFNGRAVVSHGGTNIGFINENIHDKTSGVTITVLTNQDSIGNGILLANVIGALHKVTIRYTSIEDVSDAQGVKVYPNPAHSELNVMVDKTSVIAMYDVTGRLTMTQTLNAGTNRVDLQQVSTGTYFINIIQDGAQLHRQTIQVIR